MWDEERETFYNRDFKACIGWSILQRGAWLASCLINVPVKLLTAGCLGAGSLCCLGCGATCGVCGCVRSVACCCDENSQKTMGTALVCLGLSGVLCCGAGCTCVECMEEAVVDIPAVIIPECPLNLNVLGCLHKQQKTVRELNETITSMSKGLN